MEIDKIERLQEFVSKDNYKKVYDYLVSSSHYAADTEEWTKFLNVAYNTCETYGDKANALRVAIKLDDEEKIKSVWNTTEDMALKKQIAFLLGRQRYIIEDCEDEELVSVFSNSLLSEFYIKLSEELGVLEPKKPDEVLKTHLEDGGKIDSSLLNLANTYVNAFVNVGSGQDCLMQKEDENWLQSVKDDGVMAATASLGMIYLWDINGCSSKISDYLDLKDGWHKAGACIGIGLANSGIWSDVDPAKAILEEQLESKEESVQMGAIMGLGLAYAGSGRQDLVELISSYLDNTETSTTISTNTALALGLITVGKMNEDVINSILGTLMGRTEIQLNESMSKMYGVALGLCYLGRQSKCEPALETLKSVEHPIARFCEVMVEGMAYIGSGNVLKIQEFLQKCTTHESEENSLPQAAAIISIAFLSISEEIGNDMVMRTMHHILQYCEMSVKRAIPIALAIMSVSNPKLQIVDLLCKLSHDEDAEMSRRAILALGIVSAGTNNSKVSEILRGLSHYYQRDNQHVFLVRIATGLLFMGKGLATLNPFYSDNLLYSKVAMGGLAIVATAMLDTENILCGKHHYLLYNLVNSLYPRMMFTIDENLEIKQTTVRVGQAVNTVGQAGNPRKITGFQTHTSPVLMKWGERCELATDEFIPVADVVLENFVIIKKNPEWEDPKEIVKANQRKGSKL